MRAFIGWALAMASIPLIPYGIGVPLCFVGIAIWLHDSH